MWHHCKEENNAIERIQRKCSSTINLLKNESFHEKIALQQTIEKLSEQQKALHQENRELTAQIRDKDNQILQGQRDANSLQQQLQVIQLKIDNLQDEKLILIQEKFQLDEVADIIIGHII